MLPDAPDGPAQVPSPLVDQIKSQLAETEALRLEWEAVGDRDFASEVTIQSLRSLEARMRDELRAAELLASPADAEFSLEGEPVKSHEVSARFLGDFLRSVQDLVYAVAQVVVGQPTRRAPVQGSIVATNQLAVLPDFVPGSFGVRVRLPREDELGLLPGALEENRRAVTLVGSLLSDSVPTEELTQLLSHSRVKSHYRKLIVLLAEENAAVAVRTRANPRRAVIDARRARERREWLDLLQTRTEVVELEGRLVGGTIERNRFELLVDGQSYGGTVSEKAALQMRQLHWGDTVRATVKVTTAEHEEWAGEPRVDYHAEEFALPGTVSPRPGGPRRRFLRNG